MLWLLILLVRYSKPVLSPGCRVIYNEVVQTSKYYMRDVTAIESAWLLELAPHFYQQGTVGVNRDCPPEPPVSRLFLCLWTHRCSMLTECPHLSPSKVHGVERLLCFVSPIQGESTVLFAHRDMHLEILQK